MEPAVAPPVPVRDHPERGRRLRLPFLPFQQLGLRGPRRPRGRPPPGSGSPGSAAPWRRGARRTRPAWPARPPRSGGRGRGERLHRGDDDLGLVDQQPPLGQRDPDRLERLRAQRRGEPGLPVRRRRGSASLRAPPVRRRGGTRVGLHLHGLAVAGDPGLELGDWASSGSSSTIAVAGSAGAIDQAGASRTSSGLPDPGSHRTDRVSPIAGAAVFVMPLFDHRAPTFSPPGQAVEGTSTKRHLWTQFFPRG